MNCSWSSSMSNPDRNRWKLTEQTMIRVRINLAQHIQWSNITSMTQRQESLIRAKSCHRIHLALEKLKMSFSSRPPHQRTILKDWDWENKWIVSLRDTGDNTTHMVFEGESAVKLHAKNVKLGTRVNGTSDKTKSQLGGLTVLDLLTTKASVLLGFSIMHQWLHHSWILAESLLREAATASCSSGSKLAVQACEQLPLMWSHQHRHIVCSPPAQTFQWYKGWTEEDPTHFPVVRQKRLGSTH